MQVIEKMEKRRELIETAATQVDRDVIEERGQ
jgi:hypothetical protein